MIAGRQWKILKNEDATTDERCNSMANSSKD